MSIEEAVSAIRTGRIVGMPTDTVYGVGVDPNDREAVSSLFELKGRPEHKPVGLLAASLDQARTIVEIDAPAAALAAEHWPGGLTLIVRPKVVLADWVGHEQRRTVGIRVPDHPITKELLEATGPLSVTSANRSGEPEALSDEEARGVFGDAVAVYIPGLSRGGEASTVIDVTGSEITVLRRGPVDVV